eukprot:760977-Hanusia_phi.AAC.1
MSPILPPTPIKPPCCSGRTPTRLRVSPATGPGAAPAAPTMIPYRNVRLTGTVAGRLQYRTVTVPGPTPSPRH